MREAISSIINSPWFDTAFAVVAILTTVILIFVIVSENRNPVKSLAWVTVLLLLPVVGILLYFFFGRNIKNERMISRRIRRRLRSKENKSSYSPGHLNLTTASGQQIMLGKSLTGAQFHGENTIEVFTSGRAKFDALEEDIRNARQSINIQYYIFDSDATGQRIAELLMEKARQGVKVRLIYDHVGSFSVRTRFFKRMRQAGVEAYPFFKVTFPQLATRVNWRNHRKICVIDNAIGYIGGMNIANRYIDGGKFDIWRDTHLRITGPVVDALNYSFAVDWNFTTGVLIEMGSNHTEHQKLARPEAILGVGAQVLTNGPTSQWHAVEMAFLKAILNATKRVYIQTPYFLPTEGLLNALQTAALARVDVRIMVPLASDSRMLTFASASYFKECLRSNIKIYQYTRGMLHAKMIIVDDEMVSIGSTNFDFRSFEYNFEANIFCYSQDFTRKMIQVFRDDLKDCVRITPETWRRRPILRKAAESFLRLLSPVL